MKAALILDDDTRTVLKKRKTNVRKASVSPEWNEMLTFGVEQKLIGKCRLVVSVLECDRFGNSRPLGAVHFTACGKRSAPTTRMWREAIDRGRSGLPQWLALEAIKTPTATIG